VSHAVPLPARATLRAAALTYLRNPDAVLPLKGRLHPVQVGVAAALGMLGAGVFFAVALGSVSDLGGPETVGRLLDLALVPPLAVLLSFPPLFLVTALRGRAPRPMFLLAVALSGPTVAGLALGASTPLVLLYRLTGDVGLAYGLLVMALFSLALMAGLHAAVSNQRRAGQWSPGALVTVAHYGLTLWTAAVLSAHLT